MKTLVFITLFSSLLLAKNILFIGDSHTAGPFGKNIHNLLSENHNVVTLGHSSSAPIHWLGDKVYKLSGGAFNQMSFNGKTYLNGNPTHWRVKVNVPKITPLLQDAAYHSSWPLGFEPDLIVIALGANDARALSDQSGNINAYQYAKRQEAIEEMLELVAGKCIWIGPPMGKKKTEANQTVLYEFLEKNVKGVCPFMSSNHYNVQGCDGIHMSCPSEYPKALEWAKEVRAFIHNNI
jgi:lysophospholipase L1-like esterase